MLLLSLIYSQLVKYTRSSRSWSTRTMLLGLDRTYSNPTTFLQQQNEADQQAVLQLVVLLNIIYKEELLLDFVELCSCSPCCGSSCQQAQGHRPVLIAGQSCRPKHGDQSHCTPHSNVLGPCEGLECLQPQKPSARRFDVPRLCTSRVVS